MLDVGKTTFEWAKSIDLSSWFEQETTSTNDIAKLEGFKNETSWVFITNAQTNGRGRNKNTWSNATAGDQLLATWCFKLTVAPQPISSPIFGWAVYKSLNDEFDLGLSIKAPNDIYVNLKKVGGILLESITQGESHFICVGIGLNVNSSPGDISESSSLMQEIGAEVKASRWHRLLSALNKNLMEASHMCQSKEIPSVYRREILSALKKWPNNNVSNFLSNGDLVIDDGQKIPWSEL